MSVRPILLVEDNPDDEELTRRTLERAGVANEIVVARDGEEAIGWLFGSDENGATRHAELPILVLLDLKLPKLDGHEVLRAIRRDQRTATIPVVILTSSDEDEDIVRSYRLGANSYVRKPVQSDAFADAVTQLGLYWLLVNQPPPGCGT